MLVKRTNLKVFTSKFVGTGPSSYKKKNLPGRGLTKVEKHCDKACSFHVSCGALPSAWGRKVESTTVRR